MASDMQLHVNACYVCFDTYYVQYIYKNSFSQVTVFRDSSSNDYSLDAGALVLADQGMYTHSYTYSKSIDTSLDS